MEYLSVTPATLTEAAHREDSLRAVPWADEQIVVDPRRIHGSPRVSQGAGPRCSRARRGRALMLNETNQSSSLLLLGCPSGLTRPLLGPGSCQRYPAVGGHGELHRAGSCLGAAHGDSRARPSTGRASVSPPALSPRRNRRMGVGCASSPGLMRSAMFGSGHEWR
jgi:hypothetical protein